MEKNAHRGRLWRVLGKDKYIQGVWEYVSCERAKAKKILKDAEKESRKGSKANGNVSLRPKNTWNKEKEVRMQTALPK